MQLIQVASGHGSYGVMDVSGVLVLGIVERLVRHREVAS